MLQHLKFRGSLIMMGTRCIRVVRPILWSGPGPGPIKSQPFCWGGGGEKLHLPFPLHSLPPPSCKLPQERWTVSFQSLFWPPQRECGARSLTGDVHRTAPNEQLCMATHWKHLQDGISAGGTLCWSCAWSLSQQHVHPLEKFLRHTQSCQRMEGVKMKTCCF